MKKEEILKDTILVLSSTSGWNGGSRNELYITKNMECYQYSRYNRENNEWFGFSKVLDEEVFNKVLDFIKEHIDTKYEPRRIFDVSYAIEMALDGKTNIMYNYDQEYYLLSNLIRNERGI